jgi:hypothetical protein
MWSVGNRCIERITQKLTDNSKSTATRQQAQISELNVRVSGLNAKMTRIVNITPAQVDKLEHEARLLKIELESPKIDNAQYQQLQDRMAELGRRLELFKVDAALRSQSPRVNFSELINEVEQENHNSIVDYEKHSDTITKLLKATKKSADDMRLRLRAEWIAEYFYSWPARFITSPIALLGLATFLLILICLCKRTNVTPVMPILMLAYQVEETTAKSITDVIEYVETSGSTTAAPILDTGLQALLKFPFVIITASAVLVATYAIY